jgi:peptidyl-prolyl cis-trans isomerase SurA
MRKLVLITVLVIVAALAFAETVDRIVAKVGRDVILQSDLDRHFHQIKQMEVDLEELSQMDVLRDIIESKLIFQTAKDKNYEIDEHRIRQMVDGQIKNQIAQVGSEDVLRKELRKFDMTLSDLRDYYTDMIREQRLREMIINNEIKRRINVTDLEIEDYYQDKLGELPLRPEMTEIGMIMKKIEPSERTQRAVLSEINRIYDRIREGKDFGELAKEFSDCPSKSLGGDLGFFGKGTMIKEFEEVAFTLKPGEISDIVETQFGFHIIKMEDIDDEEIRVRHILKMIQPLESDVNEAVETMQNVLERLKDGEDFGKLAETYSDDPTSEKGGVIGQFSEDNYPEMFKEHIVPLDIGEYTETIREDEYIYLFGKLRLVPEREYRLEEVKEELREYLISMKQADQYEEWINEIMKNSYVEILID